MIVCTADRPPELRGWGAGQTIDQVGMYTTNVAGLPICPFRPIGRSRLPAGHPGFRVVRGRRPRPCPSQLAASPALEPVDDVPVREYPTPDDGCRSWLYTDRLGELGGYELA